MYLQRIVVRILLTVLIQVLKAVISNPAEVVKTSEKTVRLFLNSMTRIICAIQ